MSEIPEHYILIKSTLTERKTKLIKNTMGIIELDGIKQQLQPILFDSNRINQHQVDYSNIKLGKLIGSGKRANVYMLNETQVIKVQPTDLRVYAEIDAMFHLPKSQYISNLINVISDQTTTYEIMYNVGKPMILPIAASDAEPIFNDIMKGLQIIHTSGYLHCDLHPGNVLVGSKGAVIIDFGSMQKLGPDGFYKGPVRGGRWDSMPPEQFGRDVILSSASDIYSAASTILWCLLGHAPFASEPTHASRSSESIYKMLEQFDISNDFKEKLIKYLKR